MHVHNIYSSLNLIHDLILSLSKALGTYTVIIWVHLSGAYGQGEGTYVDCDYIHSPFGFIITYQDRKRKYLMMM